LTVPTAKPVVDFHHQVITHAGRTGNDPQHHLQDAVGHLFHGAVQKVMIGDFLDIFCYPFIKNCFWKRLLTE
ncbi:hypothetical protein ACFPTR_11770, partial [Aliibacillus thermotolerans]